MIGAPVLQAFAEELSKLADQPGYLKDLQPGDVLSMQTGQTSRHKGKFHFLAGKLFEKGTQATQGTFTHSGIYVGDGKIVESRVGEGVRLKSFRDALRNKSFLVQRPKVPKRDRVGAAEFAKKQVGKGYDNLAAVATAGGLLLPERVTKLIDRNVMPAPENAQRFTCSNLITSAYRKSHLTSLKRNVSPVDIQKSENLTPVKEVLKGGTTETSPLSPRIRWGWSKRRKPTEEQIVRV